MSVNNPLQPAVQDEGTPQGRVHTFNFTGTGVTASVSAGVATVNVPSGGSGTVTSVTLTQPAAGLTITNTGVAQTPTPNSTFALANDLAAVEGLVTTGIAVRTGTDAWTTRTITGTANQITLTDGGGVAGNPTISLPTQVQTGQFAPTNTTLGITSIGGALALRPASNAAGTGFSLILQGGFAGTSTGGAGGAISLNSSPGDLGGTGGGLDLIAGQGGATGAGGAVNLTAGPGGGTSGNGGSVTIAGGTVTSGTAGTVIIKTANVNRLVIGAAGGWTVNSSEGTSGQVLTSQGPSATPQWTTVSGGSGSTFTNFTQDLGAADRSGTFDITGLSGLTADKNVDIIQTMQPIASKGNARDECEFDSIIVRGYVLNSTTIRCIWNATGVVVGTYAFAYLVSA
jgi:hypothetical protein